MKSKKKKSSISKLKKRWLPADRNKRYAVIAIFALIVGAVGYLAITRSFAYSGSFTYYLQNDPKWANSPYPYIRGTRDQSDIAMYRSGCGPTAMAMVASTLSRKALPPDVAKWYGGRFHTSDGTLKSVYPTFARDYGLKQKYLGNFANSTGRKAIQDWLKTGRGLVIVHAGPGYFTKSGHIIVLRGYNSKTKEYSVADPKNSNNNRSFYDINLIKSGNLNDAYGFTR